MPKKVTKEQIDRIVHLRDVERLPWERISEDELVRLDAKTCKRHYNLRKAEEKGPRGEGEIHAKAFRIFDRGGKPGDAVREMEITIEKAEDLYAKYLDMGKKEKDEAEPSIPEQFEMFKKRGNLTHVCEEILGNLDYPFEPSLVGEKNLIKERISFLREKVEVVRDLEALGKLGELLESEKKEIKALMDRDKELYGKRMKRERAAKMEWIVQRLMGRGVCESEEEAKEYVEEHMKLMGKGVKGIYNLEKRAERSEKIRKECLKYMSPKDYNRLGMLFLRFMPSAEYLINFWRQEQEILARYGKAGWSELGIFYEMHRDTLAEKKPNLQKEFLDHLWKRGLQPCGNCDFIIDIIGAPRQFRCGRCGVLLTRQ